MDELNFEEEFEKLSKGLEDIPNPEVAISLFDIAQTLEVVGEASNYLVQFLVQSLAGEEEEIDFPDALLPLLPHFQRTAQVITDELHDVLCAACKEFEEFEDEEED